MYVSPLIHLLLLLLLLDTTPSFLAEWGYVMRFLDFLEVPVVDTVATFGLPAAAIVPSRSWLKLLGFHDRRWKVRQRSQGRCSGLRERWRLLLLWRWGFEERLLLWLHWRRRWEGTLLLLLLLLLLRLCFLFPEWLLWLLFLSLFLSNLVCKHG